MINKEFLKDFAVKYGIGYSEVETGQGGSIIDDTGIIRHDVSLKTVNEMKEQEKKYINQKSLSEYELKKLFNDYIPMSPYDKRQLNIEEWLWQKEYLKKCEKKNEE